VAFSTVTPVELLAVPEIDPAACAWAPGAANTEDAGAIMEITVTNAKTRRIT
jgi:hypothetical protein